MRALPLASLAAALASTAATLAACGGGASSVRGGAPPAAGLDVGMAFAPADRGAAPLAALAVPIEQAKALIELVPEDERGDTEPSPDGDDDPSNDPRTTAYDLDRDGAIDLLAFPQVMYGPSNGWVVHAVEGGKPRRLFAISGAWADARAEGGAVALRFEANVLAPGEARFSTTLRFANRAWEPPIKAYASLGGKVPAARPPYASFVARGPAVLRATPEIDDRPIPNGGDAEEDGGFGRTATLRGNVLATYAAGARGTVLAAEGTWRYVAFDPATKPTETSLAHGMDDTNTPEDAPEPAPNTLQSDAWLCGWVAAAEIDVK